MYESFFRFRYRPFAVQPNTDCIFWTEGHRNAFSVIEVGLDRLSQVTVLTGGIGTGKTTLIRRLLQTSSDAFSVGLLSNFGGGRGDLLPWVLSAFGLNFSGASEAAMFRRLERYLTGEIKHGRRAVLIIDEAQNLSEPDLENLRLLSNLNADEVLMMLVLVGQPQLRAKMTRSENKRLCQRIGADYHLEPLTREDTSRYIRYRCVQAGGSADLFDPAARDEIHRVAAGVPRKINVLCDLALISAYAEGASKVDSQVVQSVVEDARRHGTYTSLTEHDIVPVEESRMVVGGGIDQMAPSEFDGSSRDPLQRLTLVLEAGGALGRPGRAGAADLDPRAARVAERRSAPSSAAQATDPNAFLDMAWSDDSLLFIEDQVDGEDVAPAPHRLHGRAGGDRRPGDPDPLPALTSSAAEGSHMRRRETTEGVVPSRPGRRDIAAAREAETAPDRPRRLSPASASMSSAARTDVALRRAFAPRAGWRRIGWRGAAGMAALAASGSMAAGIAIALLPGDSPPPTPQSEVTELRTETSGLPPELLSPAPPARAELALAGAPDPSSISAVARTTAPEARSSGGQRLSGSPGSPASVAMPQPTSLAEGGSGYAPDAPSATGLAADEPAPTPIDGLAARSAALPVRAGTLPSQGAGRGDRSAALSGRVATDRRAVRFGHPLGLGVPASTSDQAPSLTAPRGDRGARPLSVRPGDAFAHAGAGVSPPLPDAVPAAHPVRGPAPELAPVDPAATHAGVVEMNAAADVQMARGAPARPAASPFRQDAGSWNPPEAAAAAEVLSASAEPMPADRPMRAAPRQESSSVAPDPEAAFRHALDVAIEDSRAAVIAYARAAMLGHERAAYYLGQIYETGDGVAIDLAIARHWYEVSSAGNARARDRLAELPQPERSGKLAPPQALLADPSGTGHVDFVWTSGQGADPSSFVIELGAGPRGEAIAAHPVSGSAARLPLVAGVSHWRVVALDAAGRRTASDWRELSPAMPERAAAAAMPAGRL